MGQKEISVIIPCYGVEKYLPLIYKDLQQQTFKNTEFIFINDGGSNEIDNILHRFSQSDDRVRIIRQNNAGVSVARNHGISIANGEWIVFVDPDDRLEKWYLDSLLSSVKNTESVLGIGGFEQIYVKKKYKVEHFSSGDFKDVQIKEALSITPRLQVPWNKIYKRSFLIENDLKFPIGVTYLEDELFNLQVFQYVSKCGIVRDCGYRYMMHDHCCPKKIS